MTERTLLDLVDDLTLPKIHRIEQEVLNPIPDPETGAQAVDEDGNLRWRVVGSTRVPARTDALLQQLMDAITASMGGPSGKGKLAFERLPLDADALARAIRITGTIAKWCVPRGVRPTDDPIHNLRAWRDTLSPTLHGFDPDGGHEAVLRGWVREIEGLLDPWDEGDLDDPCPRCGALVWHSTDDTIIPGMCPDYCPGRPRPLVFKFRRTDGEHMIARAWAHCRACDPNVEAPWRLEELRDAIKDAA